MKSVESEMFGLYIDKLHKTWYPPMNYNPQDNLPPGVSPEMMDREIGEEEDLE